MKKIRVRFAPSPTGFMHLGSVRIALINYLFAKQKNGTLVLRIEDTDAKRNINEISSEIIKDLNWLKIDYDEGPEKGGTFGPYFQSQRNDIYSKYLDTLIEKEKVYRCFCTSEELEKKRKRQLALKLPPRYDKSCLKFPENEIENKLKSNTPFIWRFELDQNKSVEFHDLAHKKMHFDLKHFSDIPITRQDGTFTFMFANCIDDHEMQISHVFRGEDHLSNTAGQVALYQALNFKIPVFWHLPIIGNVEGKKLSKRDFGFSLNDLKSAGFLSEAICNYLAIIGGHTQKEIMNREELIQFFDFENINQTGIIKYDFEKLKWINHQWIINYNKEKLAKLCKDFLKEDYPEVEKINEQKFLELIEYIQPEMATLKDSVKLLEFYFKKPIFDENEIKDSNFEEHKEFLEHVQTKIKDISESIEIVETIKNECKLHNKKIKDIFRLIRIGLTGKPQGPGIGELFEVLGKKESLERFKVFLTKTF